MNPIESIKKFSRQTVGVVGDLMADHYIVGDVDRISPEAPTPVVLVKEERIVPGGAGNTAVNVAALGGKVCLVSMVGKDEMAKKLLNLLGKKGINVDGVIASGARPTIQKTRIIGKSQQMLRLDRENLDYINAAQEKRIISFIHGNIKNWNALIVSDYAKGLISGSLAKQIVKLTNKRGCPLVVDTKPKHFKSFAGATVLTPNRKEAEGVFGQELKNEKDIRLAGKTLQKKFNSNILITLGAEGATLFGKNKISHFPSAAREVYDVTGAGDTLVAVLALALASGINLRQAARISNLAAGIVVGKMGTASVYPQELKNSVTAHKVE